MVPQARGQPGMRRPGATFRGGERLLGRCRLRAATPAPTVTRWEGFRMLWPQGSLDVGMRLKGNKRVRKGGGRTTLNDE